MRNKVGIRELESKSMEFLFTTEALDGYQLWKTFEKKTSNLNCLNKVFKFYNWIRFTTKSLDDYQLWKTFEKNLKSELSESLMATNCEKLLKEPQIWTVYMRSSNLIWEFIIKIFIKLFIKVTQLHLWSWVL